MAVIRKLKKQRDGLLAINEKLREVLAQSDSAVEKLLASMIHEFRGPINSMICNLELLEVSTKRQLGSKQKENLKVIKSCSEILLNQINHSLDVIKLETGNLEFDYKPCNLRKLALKILKVNKLNGLRKGLTMQLIIDKKLPFLISLDEGRFSQLLLNLLSNAIKFTSSGSITINIQYAPDNLV
jgi:signal transduction histidine kinase